MDDAHKILGPGNRVVLAEGERYGERLNFFEGHNDVDKSQLIYFCGIYELLHKTTALGLVLFVQPLRTRPLSAQLVSLAWPRRL